MKRLTVMMIAAMLCLAGCGSVGTDNGSEAASAENSAASAAESISEESESAAEESEPDIDEELTCTMTVNTTYSGWGEGGQDLGSGSFSNSFEVKAGDVFLENFGGEWYSGKKTILGDVKKESEYDSVIAEITEVTADSVTVKLNEGEVTLKRGESIDVDSMFMVCDGTNYHHSIVFGDDTSGSPDDSEPVAESTGSCTLAVDTTYGGTGIAGQDLGSGEFITEFKVKAGDAFIEEFDGHWTPVQRNAENADRIIAQVVSVTSDSVTVLLADGEKTLKYDSSENVRSSFVVCDGINYSHKITFSGYEAD